MADGGHLEKKIHGRGSFFYLDFFIVAIFPSLSHVAGMLLTFSLGYFFLNQIRFKCRISTKLGLLVWM